MVVLVLLAAVLFFACGPVGEMIQNPGQPTTHTASTTEKNIDEYQLEAYDGPKARVAVSRFEDQSGKGGGTVYAGYPGYWYTPQIGNGMADMLSDGLLRSNRFIVLDRQTIKEVLQEQDLGASGRVSRETAAAIGSIEGADLLIKGSVTEFEPGSAGAGAGAALGYFGLPGLVAGGVLSGVRQSHVAIIIQAVDARTSRILFSTTVEGKANDFNLGGLLGGFGGSVAGVAGLGSWQKTPVEKAIRVAILQAVQELSKRTPQTYFRHGEAGMAKSTVSTARPTQLGFQPAPAPTAQETSSPSPAVVDSPRIRQAQELLRQRGFDPGPADGAMGAKTRAAIAQFQSSRMKTSEPSGRLDEATLAALRAMVGEKSGAAQPVASQAKTAAAEGDMPSTVFVNVTKANLQDSPGPGAKSVGTVTQGTKLNVQADDKESYFIVTDEGMKGWISKALTRR